MRAFSDSWLRRKAKRPPMAKPTKPAAAVRQRERPGSAAWLADQVHDLLRKLLRALSTSGNTAAAQDWRIYRPASRSRASQRV
jgi:hypothetical protein